LQQALKDLERAYKNVFQKRASFPRFKKRGQRDSLRYPQGVKLDQANNRISLPKLGWISYRNSQGCQHVNVGSGYGKPAGSQCPGKNRVLACGYTENADINGAHNILAAGHATLACGEMAALGRAMKHEPIEASQTSV